MKLKQLSALLLVVSLMAIPSVRPMDESSVVSDDTTIIDTDMSTSGDATEFDENAVVSDDTGDTAVQGEATVAAKESSTIERRGKSAGSKVERKKRTVAKSTGKTKKSKSKTSARKSRLAKKPVKQKVDKTTVAQIGKYNRNGDVKSFKSAADGLVKYMNDVKDGSRKATALEKADLYRAVARMSWVSGRARFNTKEHLNVAIDLLAQASDQPKLFPKARLNQINKWLAQKHKQLNNFGKKDSKKVAKKAVKVKKAEKKSTAFDDMQQKRQKAAAAR